MISLYNDLPAYVRSLFLRENIIKHLFSQIQNTIICKHKKGRFYRSSVIFELSVFN